MTGNRRRISGFFAMALSAMLSLGVILFLAAMQGVDAYAEFVKGMIYGGVAAVLLGFGNDTILARLSEDRSVDVRVVVFIRILVFFGGGLISALGGVKFLAGFVIVSSAIMLHRFYFEMRDQQPQFNLLSVVEKVALAVLLVLAWSMVESNGDTVLLVIAAGWKVGGATCFAWYVLRRESNPQRWDFKRSVIALVKVGAPFFMSYLFIQIAAVVASERATAEHVADFGTASQIGSALITAVSFWQRPVINRYFGSSINIKAEMISAGILTLFVASTVLVLLHHFGGVFHLDSQKSVIWGFCIYAMSFALLHPLELAGYASGNITPSRFMRASLATGMLSVPSALILGLWSVPLLMLVNTIVLVWSIRQPCKDDAAKP
jgi:hypothetical protein